jgi:hypothetical protein
VTAAAASALPSPLAAAPAPPVSVIPPTTVLLAFKNAILRVAYLSAAAAPGVAVIAGPNAVGLSCTAVAALRVGLVVAALSDSESHHSDSPWTAALLATVQVPPLAA